MSIINPQIQKQQINILKTILNEPNLCWVIHYSCESFYERKNGASPRITSIAIKNIGNNQTVSFSIIQSAEINKITVDDIDDQYDLIEKKMLDDYYNHLKLHPNVKYIHWNMKDSNYGFSALNIRYRVLGGVPIEIHNNDKYNLADIFYNIYGKNYADNPKMASLRKINEINNRNFLNGNEEAKAFEEKKYFELQMSTSSKVELISRFLDLQKANQLKVQTSRYQLIGGWRGVLFWLIENKIKSIATSLFIIAMGFRLDKFLFNKFSWLN